MVRLFLICFLALPTIAHAQQWTSTDVGDVGIAGDATSNGTSWTVRGSGADIWGTTDAFQFLHRTTNRSGFIVARVADLQASHPYAKAGVMIRASLDAAAATAILDVKPDGGIEFMVRAADGAAMQYIGGTSSTAAVWLRLGWTSTDVTAWTSTDGAHWTVVNTANVNMPSTPQAGAVVTSHDNAQLATATFDNLSVGIQQVGWTPHLVGSGMGGESATEQNGVWTIAGAGSDIWGTSDNFEFLSRSASGSNLHVVARIDDLQNTHPFAKAGIMLRAALDAGAAAVLIDVTPGGQVEFMARPSASSEMLYLGGTTVTLPVWLQLSWSAGANMSTQVAGAVSSDGLTWTPVGSPASVTLPDSYHVGVAVTSHDTSHAATAHVDGLSLLPSGWSNGDVGPATLLGNAAIDSFPNDVVLTVEGAGTDIWGSADNFHFVQLPAALGAHVALTYRVISIDNTNPFAKAGLMFRDSTSAGAPSVILDAKPDGGVEFMSRLCSQCATTYLGGTSIVFPAFLSLTRDGNTFTATVFTADPSDGTTIGSVTVPMADPLAGFAVTSHDAARTATAIFDNPAR
jgi:hypothetical protein